MAERTSDQEKIVAQWKAFANTDAYKDWQQSMQDSMGLLQGIVDNMVENRPGPNNTSLATPIDNERAGNLNQRKVGIKYALEYAQLRVDA